MYIIQDSRYSQLQYCQCRVMVKMHKLKKEKLCKYLAGTRQ